MATVSLGRKTRVTLVQTALKIETITPVRTTWCLIGKDASDDVTRDHKSARLQGGSSYQFQTTPTLTRVSLLSDDVGAPDDALPQADPRAALLDITES